MQSKNINHGSSCQQLSAFANLQESLQDTEECRHVVGHPEQTIIELPEGRQAVAKGIWKQISDRQATWKHIDDAADDAPHHPASTNPVNQSRTSRQPTYVEKLLMKIALGQRKCTRFDKMLPLTFEVEEVESEAEEEQVKTGQSQINPSYSDLKSDVLNILHEKMFKKKYV